jgi:acyl-CoA synthetase (AMP-forming)/AMP-acid ligase II
MKLRGCPINVNYRYREEELVYLLNNADAQAVIFQSDYADRIEAIKSKLTGVRCFIQVGINGSRRHIDGGLNYEDAISAADPMPRIARSQDDLYMLYTGGTTGMPKGVMYSNGGHCSGLSAYTALIGAPPVGEGVTDLAGQARQLKAANGLPIGLVCCPLMHGTGMWVGAMITQLAGGAALTVNHLGLDADLIWSQAQQHQASLLTIVGDAFARPLLAALDNAADKGSPYDVSSVKTMISSGVMWSQEIKQGLLKHADMTLIDAMGSTEGGMGTSVSTRESAALTAKFELNEDVKVFTEDDKEVTPGSGEMGMIATESAMMGYYKDPEKTAKTVRVIDGVRYVFPGDFATVESDGSLTLLGRGSMCINTAGEKVFPEEVEEITKSHDDVEDCLVVGVPDEKFGERVVAVVSRKAQAAAIDSEAQSGFEVDVQNHCRSHLAGYKTPKNVLLVDTVQRAPNGKADYKWAKATALDRLGLG